MAALPAPSAIHAPVPHLDLGALRLADLCALPVAASGEAVAGAKPFSRIGSNFAEPYVATAPPGDECFVANDNIARTENESRSARASGTRTDAHTVAATSAAPRYLDRIASHLHLTETELAMLRANSFVALDRVEFESYATAFHDIFQEQLPIFVSTDSVLNSVFQANGEIIEKAEVDLQLRLTRILDRLQRTLGNSVSRYGRETAEDLDVYLGVAHALATASTTGSVLGREEPIAELLARVAGPTAGLERVALFGRDRMFDFSQLTPRGRYTHSPAYFRAAMWLSRLEWNLSSRSCRSSSPELDATETPREARDAMALADLVRRAGALGDLQAFDDVYTALAGPREDVSVPELLRLLASASIRPTDADAPARLRAALGTHFERTTRVHFMPDGATTLPVIATLLGPRITPDAGMLTGLVADAVPGRARLGAADVAFLLGHDRALAYLKNDLAAFPLLRDSLDRARASLKKRLPRRRDLYSEWATAVARIADVPVGVTPAFMRTDAYRDMAFNSAVVGYGQIRHNYALLAAQPYDSYGCEIPDGYVEPALGTYDALLEYAATARALEAKALRDPDAPPMWGGAPANYWERVIQVLGMLRGIVVTELAGQPLSSAQRRWLGMVAEFIPQGGYSADSGEPPHWTGWYFDLFPNQRNGAEKSPAFIGDYFTFTNAQEVAYLGADKPRLGVFLIDVNGEPRAMVGPVAKGWELTGPLASRMDNAKARTAPGKRASWMSYLAPDVPLPEMRMVHFVCEPDDHRVLLQSDALLGDTTVTLLDHHGDAITTSATSNVGPNGTVFAFHLTPALMDARYGVEGMHARVHDLSASGLGQGPADLTYGVRIYADDAGYAHGYGEDDAAASDDDTTPLHHPFQRFWVVTHDERTVKVTVTGATPAVVGAADLLAGESDALAVCYRRAIRTGGGTPATVALIVHVAPDGAVLSVEPGHDAGAADAALECVSRKLRFVKFHAPGAAGAMLHVTLNVSAHLAAPADPRALPDPRMFPDPSLPGVDRARVAATLFAVAATLQSCKAPGGPTGRGHVTIGFSTDGHVSSAVVDQPPFAGTPVGACVEERFRSATIPPFNGAGASFGKRFDIF